MLPGDLATVFAPRKPAHRPGRGVWKIKNKIAKPKKWYSSIGHRLQTGLMLVFLLWRSDFKSKTIFGFLSPNYTGHVFWIF